MKIFVTGVAGLLGSNIARRLTKDHKIVGCDTFIGGLKDNVPDCQFYEIDILDTKAMTKAMEDCEMVIHTAALPYEGLSVFSPAIVTQNIVGGTVSVASAALANGTDMFINFSSMARYGNQTPPFTEDMPTAPEDPYGLAKVQAEEHLALLHKLHGLEYMTIVPHNVVGVGQRYMDPYRNVVAIMINRLKQGKKVVIYGDGKQKRSFSNVADCVDAVERIIESDRDLVGEVYNIGPDDNEIEIIEIAKKIGHHLEKYPHFDHYPDRPAEVKNAWCSSEKIKSDFNYNASITLDQTIHEMCSWIERRGPEEFDYALDLEFVTDETPLTWVERLI
tara:strand:+ start:23 stop:1021 length:999 start_codon:yes stop_codon:yes gene_type:complete